MPDPKSSTDAGVDVSQVFAAYSPIAGDLNPRAKFCLHCGRPLKEVSSGGQSRLACDCGYVLYRNPAAGVTVLLLDGERFLLCRRHPQSYLGGGKWCLPGGHIEWNESFLEAAVRETKEETGLDVELESLLSVTSNFHTPDLHSIAVVLKARPRGGELATDEEIDDLRWYTKGEALPEMAFAADTHIIERYFANPEFGAPIDARFARLAE
jgi:ADP-ribose pyrophosphatase YjhB (NUDIX family)